MPWWVVVLVLALSNVALRAAAAAIVPEAAKPWTTPNLLTWVAWFVVVLPATLVAWSNLDERLLRRRLQARLAAWKATGTEPLGALAVALLEGQQYPLLEELLVALEPRREGSPEVAAFVEASRKHLAAASHGSGAFHGDGWAALGVTETRDAAKQAASALR